MTYDDVIRKETTYECLAKLKPALKKDDSTTAGNATRKLKEPPVLYINLFFIYCIYILTLSGSLY